VCVIADMTAASGLKYSAYFMLTALLSGLAAKYTAYEPSVSISTTAYVISEATKPLRATDDMNTPSAAKANAVTSTTIAVEITWLPGTPTNMITRVNSGMPAAAMSTT